MSMRYGRRNPDAEAWYDPADGAVYAGGASVDEALEEQQRRERQDQEAADADIVGIDSKRPADPLRRVAWRRASEIAIKRRSWLWADQVPLGETTLFVGHAGVGKSQGAAWLSAQVTRGMLPGELEGQSCPVMYVATEDSWEYTLAPRLLAAGADMDRVLAVHTETQIGSDIAVGTLSLAVDVPSLRDAVEATGARVIVLDALLSAMTGADLMKQGVVRCQRTFGSPVASGTAFRARPRS
ncbi:AAA family ATPase [Saccharopolyspora hattusasensis]|uniref:AAA family ATPase n=1 Tax=Saccharopolyspora hattusasensis TaxID=1128679 RepID=UPI003D973B9A